MSIATQPPPVAAEALVKLPESKPALVASPFSPSTFGDRIYRLTLDQYHAMAKAGILGSEDRLELLEGLLVTKMTKNDLHILVNGLAQDSLVKVIPAGWFVSMGDPIKLPDAESEPEPDIKIVRGVRHDYKNRRVLANDVALVIEVSDSSVQTDRTVKKPLYARASIPCYWIINLPANRVEVYSDPTGPDPSPDYRRRVDLGIEDQIPLILDGHEVAQIAVRDLLP